MNSDAYLFSHITESKKQKGEVYKYDELPNYDSLNGKLDTLMERIEMPKKSIKCHQIRYLFGRNVYA